VNFPSVFLYKFCLGFTTLISCAPFLFFGKISFRARTKAALEMTTNEEDDDDDIDIEEEEELLRRDVDRLLEEIAFLEETSSSSSLRNGELESRLETLEQNRVSIARRMTTMKKKKKKKQSGNNNNDDDYGTTAFSLLSSRIHEVAEYVDSAVRNTVVSNQRKTREENILRELDLFVDGDEDAIETNTSGMDTKIRDREFDDDEWRENGRGGFERGAVVARFRDERRREGRCS
jgi:chromosome segregation ATPase